jgi:BlaI family penicillinase repressor
VPDTATAPQISDAEWTVMRVFWRIGKANTAKVIAELEGQTTWKPKTIQTLIRRLVQKGALDFEKNGREHVYRPAVDEKSCVQDASSTFLDRVFDGKLAPFLANLVDRRDCSPDDLAELKKILEDKIDGDAS